MRYVDVSIGMTALRTVHPLLRMSPKDLWQLYRTRPALRKLEQLDWSLVLDDLRVPPGNQLEALKKDRKGQHSIRINDQWRVCLVWKGDGAHDVEIVDYR